MTIVYQIFKIALLTKCVTSYEMESEYADYGSDSDQNGVFIGRRTNTGHNDHVKTKKEVYHGLGKHYDDLSSHAMVTDSNVFPYMACVLKGSKYISSGALIDESWVLTTADGLFLMSETIRFIRIRLGSINYKKGGTLLPVKMIELHPYFDDNRPNFDLALIMLAKPVRYTPNLKAIRLQVTPKDITATHFIVTSWRGPLEAKSKNISHLQSMEMIKRHRILTVTHLHPSSTSDCNEELQEIGTSKNAIMCLEPPLKNPCMRDIGAPVVLNNVLWAVVSSWKPDDCDDTSSGPIFATLMSSSNVSTWIHATVHGHRWKPNESYQKKPNEQNEVVRSKKQ